MTDFSSQLRVWSEQEWLSQDDRDGVTVLDVVAIVLAVVSLTLYVHGQIVVNTTPAIVYGLGVSIVGLGTLLVAAVTIRLAHPYRRVAGVSLRTVFHISRSEWAVGETLVLDIKKCRVPQIIADGHRRRASRLVYFFPRRPTRNHARGASTAGRKSTPRYLYALEVDSLIVTAYRRGPAMGVPMSLRVTVLTRQAIPGTTRTGSGVRGRRH